MMQATLVGDTDTMARTLKMAIRQIKDRDCALRFKGKSCRGLQIYRQDTCSRDRL